MEMVGIASRNKYLHKDFHIAMNYGLEYLSEKYGDEAVAAYLRQFAAVFYSPLKKQLAVEGLKAIRAHYEYIYGIEEVSGDLECCLAGNELEIRVKKCPAVSHMNRKKVAVSRHYIETLRTVNKAICEGTGYLYSLESYDTETGASVERYIRSGRNKVKDA